MEIPQSFNDKVIQIFGEKGAAWREKLPKLLESCINKWNLSNCRTCSQLSINFICYGESPEYGEVALKIGVPHTDLFTEMRALAYYNGRHICKCYDYDLELGAMLLERITPGVQLKTSKDSNERIEIGAEVISKLPIPIDETHDFPTYREWVNRTFKRAREENKVGEKMLYYIDEAETLFKEIETYDKSRVLLHGDLHHENILKNNKGGWTIIDPKGVIGPRSMEAARFIENEFSFVETEERIRAMDKMASIFSERLGTTKHIIGAGAFVLKVLSICWCFEDYIQGEEVYEYIKECEMFLSFAKGSLSQ